MPDPYIKGGTHLSGLAIKSVFLITYLALMTIICYNHDFFVGFFRGLSQMTNTRNYKYQGRLKYILNCLKLFK